MRHQERKRVPHPSDVFVFVRWVGDSKAKPSAIGLFMLFLFTAPSKALCQAMTSVAPITPIK